MVGRKVTEDYSWCYLVLNSCLFCSWATKLYRKVRTWNRLPQDMDSSLSKIAAGKYKKPHRNIEIHICTSDSCRTTPTCFNRKWIFVPLPQRTAFKSLQGIMAGFTRDPTPLLALGPDLSEASGFWVQPLHHNKEDRKKNLRAENFCVTGDKWREEYKEVNWNHQTPFLHVYHPSGVTCSSCSETRNVTDLQWGKNGKCHSQRTQNTSLPVTSSYQYG